MRSSANGEKKATVEVDDLDDWRENSRLQTDRLEAIASILEAVAETGEPWAEHADLASEVRRLALRQAAEVLRGGP